MRMDARVPVVFGALDEAAPDDAVLLEADGFPPGRHGLSFRPGPGMVAEGCACCAPRGTLARAIGEMFAMRARGEFPFFRRVVAVAETAEGEAALRAALTDDPICASRFRLA